jgi:DNA-binding NtrC family response regulator
MALVLIVDDSIAALEAMAAILDEAGHQVLTCTCGRRASQLLQDKPVDLLITDLFMPGVDGLELMRNARRICPTTPVVVMSGVKGQLGMLHVAQRLGACCTLPKPCSKADVTETVAVALRMPCSALRGSPADARNPGSVEPPWPSCSRCPAVGTGQRQVPQV